MYNYPNRSSKSKIARAYVASRRGVERVRVTKSGEVHAYGVLPNTNQTGWYLAGDVATLADMAHAEEMARRQREGVL